MVIHYMTKTDVEEKSITEEKPVGSDHYARFYKFLTKQHEFDIEPEMFGKLLREGLSVKPFVEDLERLHYALASYIEEEVRRQLGEKIPVSVQITHESDFKWHYIVAETQAKIGGVYYRVKAVEEPIGKWDRIAGSREEFNELVNDIINKIVVNVRKIRVNTGLPV